MKVQLGTFGKASKLDFLFSIFFEKYNMLRIIKNVFI